MELIGRKTALNPTKIQCALFAQSVGVRRAVYNHLVANALEFSERGLLLPLKQFISDQGKDLTFRRNHPLQDSWEEGLSKLPACLGDRALQDYRSAWQKFFESIQKGNRKARPPRFSKKGSHESFRLRGTIVIQSGSIRLPKPYGVVKLFEKDYLPPGKYDTLQVCISRVGHRWYVSASFDVDTHDKLYVGIHDRAGIDVGLKTLATLWDGNKFTYYKNPKPLNRILKKLRRLQRAQDRRTLKTSKVIRGKEVSVPKSWREQSKRRWKTIQQIRKLYAQSRFIRQYNHHAVTTEIVRRYKTIVIENLNVTGMMQGRQSRALSDASLGEFLSMLKYKAARYGREVVEMGRFYPSSKTCHRCGNVNKELKRADKWICPICCAEHQRDENAAKVAYQFRCDAGVPSESLNGKATSRKIRKTRTSSIDQIMCFDTN
jgi:putative transposase